MMDDDVLNDRDVKRAMVCALADGQLRGQDFADAMESVYSNADSRAAWHSYHVIGDVLRSPELAEQVGDRGFLARFQSRLASDAQAQVAYKRVPTAVESKDVLHSSKARNASANDSAFAWKLTAGCASLAAVVAIGWSMVVGLNGTSGGAELARAVSPTQASSTAVAVSESAVMIRDPNLDALLAAHKQLGGTTALQMPTGFLRNATFEGAAR